MNPSSRDPLAAAYAAIGVRPQGTRIESHQARFFRRGRVSDSAQSAGAGGRPPRPEMPRPLPQPSGIRQHDATEVLRPRRAEHASSESLRHEARQVSAVIEVRVRQHDRVQVGGVQRQILPVPLAQLFQPLEEPGIQEHRRAVAFHQVLDPVTVRAAPKNVRLIIRRSSSPWGLTPIRRVRRDAGVSPQSRWLTPTYRDATVMGPLTQVGSDPDRGV